MTDLKPGWKRVKFGDVVRLSKETCKDPETAGIERVIGLEHLEPGDLRVRSWADLADGTTFSNRVRPGQVLFGKRRAYQRKVAVADFDAICSGDIYVFESADPKRLLPELLPFICQTEAFFEYAVGTSAGSLSPRTNWKSLAAYEFALPPPDEQERITRMLDAVDMASLSLERAHEAAQMQIVSSQGEFLSGLSPDEFRPLLQVSSRVGVGIASSATHAYAAIGVPMIRNTDISEEGISTEGMPFVSAEFDEANKNKRVRCGDIVVARTGKPGTAAVVPRELDYSQTFTTLIVSPISGIIDPNFLALWINSPPARSFIRKMQAGGVQQNMNATLLGRLPVWTPSIGTQLEILNTIDTLKRAAMHVCRRRSDICLLRGSILNSCLRA